MEQAVEINGYRLSAPLQNNHSGFSKWGFAEKNGSQYFLKEFLSPVYPLDAGAFSRTQFERQRTECREYEHRQYLLYTKIDGASRGGLVRISEFFRSGSHYYISTQKVDGGKLSMDEIASTSEAEKRLLCLTVAYALSCLHGAGLVHCDIKPDNILVRRTAGKMLTGKLIDFDACFEESSPPSDEEELNGDLTYLAPEAFRKLNGENVALNAKLDIFALGLVMHQYYTGNLPGFWHDQYDYPFEAVLDDSGLFVSSHIPEDIAGLLRRMLAQDPAERPTAAQVWSALAGKESPVPPAPRPGCRGR